MFLNPGTRVGERVITRVPPVSLQVSGPLYPTTNTGPSRRRRHSFGYGATASKRTNCGEARAQLHLFALAADHTVYRTWFYAFEMEDSLPQQIHLQCGE